MRWLKAFGWIPTPVFYFEEFWKPLKKFGGFQSLCFIFIKKKYKEDEGIHVHELEHVEQGYCLLFLFHSFLYKFVRKYRLWAEVRAYRKQIETYGPGASIEFAVRALVKKYKLNITEEKARALLSTGV